MIKLIMLCTIVTASIYNALPAQTNEFPFVTASNKKIDSLNPGKHKWIAVSRDLETLGFTFGTKVCIENAGKMNGIWTVQDRMNKKWIKKIDFLVNTNIKYGKWNKVLITIIK